VSFAVEAKVFDQAYPWVTYRPSLWRR